MFIGRRYPIKYNGINTEYSKVDMSYDPYTFFYFDVNWRFYTTDGFHFFFSIGITLLWSGKTFQLVNHTLLNELHAYGDRYEEKIGKHLSDVDDMTHQGNSMQYHSLKIIILIPQTKVQLISIEMCNCTNCNIFSSYRQIV